MTPQAALPPACPVILLSSNPPRPRSSVPYQIECQFPSYYKKTTVERYHMHNNGSPVKRVRSELAYHGKVPDLTEGLTPLYSAANGERWLRLICLLWHIRSSRI